MGTRADYEEIQMYRNYLMDLGETNTREHSRLLQNLRLAVLDELTPRQQEMVMRCYICGESMTNIAADLGVNVSTVSRTIARGKARLRKCLKYGARSLILEDAENR